MKNRLLAMLGVLIIGGCVMAASSWAPQPPDAAPQAPSQKAPPAATGAPAPSASAPAASPAAAGQAPATARQAPPATPPASGPQQPARPSGSQTPNFRVNIDLVTTDVIVRDSKGQFVSDLNKDDFDVLEDGVPQKVESFVLVHGGRQYNFVAPPPAPVQEGIILPQARPTNDTAGRIFIFFVDDLHLDFKATGRLRDLFQKIKKTLIHDGDMFGIVSSGPSSIAIDLTYDTKRFDEAIKKMSGSGLKPSDIIEAPEGSEGPAEVRYRANVAFSTIYDLLNNLSQVHDRRKSLIYVSNGYDFNPFTKTRYGESQLFPKDDPNDQGVDPFIKQGQEFSEADLVRELGEVTRAANRANTTIYTIDPRGLGAEPDLDEKVDPQDWQDYLRMSQDSLRVLADETGGIAVVNQNDFDKALKRIDAETSDYYVLGYYSSNPDPLHRTRQLTVKVKRPGLDIWSRKSYSLKPTRGRASR